MTIGKGMKRVAFLLACFMAGVILLPPVLRADIYVRRGDDGTLHFSNCPIGSDWKLYARESARPYRYASYPAQRTRKYSPAQYDGIISAVARSYGLSPSLIKSVIEVESGYNPYAVSPKGAMGLMQIMPQTAQDLGLSDPWDPAQNIDAGTRYLSWLLRKYNGNLMLALAAYNAGPSAVDTYGGIPPYQETTEYVKSVLGRLYGGGYASQ